MSMERIISLENVTVDVLFHTDISQILYEKIRCIGKICRKILLKFQALCRTSNDFEEEELPNISDISEDEEETNQSTRSRSFRTLFTRNPRPRESAILVAGHV